MTEDQSILYQQQPCIDSNSLDSRVFEFEKCATLMIQKLDATCAKIEQCTDNFDAIEHLKLSIAPDAASLISQGDTLVLETHGKSTHLSSKVMKIQAQLRDKFREMKFGRKQQNTEFGQNISEFAREKELVDKQFITDYLTANDNNVEKMLQKYESNEQFTLLELQKLLDDIQVKQFFNLLCHLLIYRMKLFIETNFLFCCPFFFSLEKKMIPFFGFVFFFYFSTNEM